MKQKQTAEQAAAMANAHFQGRGTARVTDAGNRVRFDLAGIDSIEAVGDQVFDVERFKRLLINLEDGMQRLAKKTLSSR